jgi:hypothetical protein
MRQPFSFLLTRCARRLAGAALLLVVSLATHVPGAARAEDEPLAETPRFDVRSAYLEPVDGVLDLNATLDLSLSRNALQALRSGVPLSFQLDLSLNRKRRYLPDEGVAHLAQRWRLQYHALSERDLRDARERARRAVRGAPPAGARPGATREAPALRGVGADRQRSGRRPARCVAHHDVLDRLEAQFGLVHLDGATMTHALAQP